MFVVELMRESFNESKKKKKKKTIFLATVQAEKTHNLNRLCFLELKND